jgi:hypothetical protein
MIDFIEATQYQCKDSPFLGHCKPFPCKLNQYGWQTYTLQGCKEMEVHWNPEMGALRVKGSLPYYLQGHNFSFSNGDFVEGIGMIQGLLGVPLWDATLEAFEFGCIFPVEVKPALYIRNHNATSKAHLYMNEKGRDKGAFRWWEDSSKSLKLYDAKKNILMKQDLKAREVIKDAGYNPEGQYLKFEAHWKKPYLLNNGRNLVLEDLQNPDFLHYLAGTLIEQYHLLMPMRTLIQPTSKKDLSALDAVLSVYVENLMNQGIPIEEARKKVYAYINQAGCLDKQDKDARKATIRKAFGKLQESNESQWDLTHKIENALAVEDRG